MYTISLVANKLGENMLSFSEDFSYSQGKTKCFVKKGLYNNLYAILKSNKNYKLFLFVYKIGFY